MSRLAEAYARFGGLVETHAIIRRAMEIDPTDGLVLYHCACAHALLGERAQALQLLCRAFDAGFRGVIHAARSDSAFEPLQGDPEFQRLIAEVS
jgi:hypothetical protein